MSMQTSEVKPALVHIILVESGQRGPDDSGENWILDVRPTSDGLDVVAPFTQFRRSGYQPAGEDANGRLNLERILRLAVQPDPSATSLVTLAIRDLRLAPRRLSRPPVYSGPITGPADSDVGRTGAYSFPVTDPDGDRLSCLIDWGVGETTETAFEPRTDPTALHHQWTRHGVFSIRAKAVDEQGVGSGWTEPFAVTVRSSAGMFADDFSDISRWSAFEPGGVSVDLASAPGKTGGGLRVRVDRQGLWGLVWIYDATRFGPASQYAGIRIAMRSVRKIPLQVTVMEIGTGGPSTDGEIWIAAVAATPEWSEVEIPFARFAHASWQPQSAKNDGKLDLDSLGSIRIGPVGTGAPAEFLLDDLWLLSPGSAGRSRIGKTTSAG
jgi:hypothetical protein